MGFMAVFSVVYCRRDQQQNELNSDSDEDKTKLTWEFSGDFVTQEATTFRELKGKVDEGSKVIGGIEQRLMKIETFVGSGNLDEFIGN